MGRLDGLKDLDWASFRHAYGSAWETPRWIRDLASNNPQIRHEAQNSFENAVLHQEFVYEATRYALPFLFELIADRSAPDREEITRFVWLASYSIVWGSRAPDLLARNAPELELFGVGAAKTD